MDFQIQSVSSTNYPFAHAKILTFHFEYENIVRWFIIFKIFNAFFHRKVRDLKTVFRCKSQSFMIGEVIHLSLVEYNQ